MGVYVGGLGVLLWRGGGPTWGGGWGISLGWSWEGMVLQDLFVNCARVPWPNSVWFVAVGMNFKDYF